jgi:hypothetical protein
METKSVVSCQLSVVSDFLVVSERAESRRQKAERKKEKGEKEFNHSITQLFNYSVIQLLSYSIILLLLQSCSTMYIPASRSIPLLEKKGELQGEGGISTNSLYANISGAITDDIAISVNGNLSYRSFSNRYDLFTDIYEKPPKGSFYFTPPDTRGKFAHRYGEVSVGKINMIPLSTLKLEVFGGTGMGRATDIDYFYNEHHYKVDYYSFFGQGNFGFKEQKTEAGISVRLAYSTLNYIAYYDKKNSCQENFGAFHIEPMSYARIGGENLKVVFRLGYSFTSSINLSEETYHHRGFEPIIGRWEHTRLHFSVGLSYRIGGEKNKNITY